MFTELSTDPVLSILVAAFVVLLGIGTRYLVQFLKAQVEVFKATTDSKVFSNIIDLVMKNAENIVFGLQVTIVDELKEKAADGKLTKEEIGEIQKAAYDKLLGSLSEETKVTLTSLVGDLADYLPFVIEKALAGLKKDGTIKNPEK